MALLAGILLLGGGNTLAREGRYLVCGDLGDRAVAEAPASSLRQARIQEYGFRTVLTLEGNTDSKMPLAPRLPSPPQKFQVCLNVFPYVRPGLISEPRVELSLQRLWEF